MRNVAAAVVAATAVYALALASRDPWDLAAGALLGLAVALVFRAFVFPENGTARIPWYRRVLHFPALVVATAVEIVRGTFQVARVVLSPSRAARAGFVDIPVGERTPSGVAINGLLNTLSPGSVFIDVDPATGSWRIHTIDASDPNQVRADIQRHYERYQRPVWP
jgi:multisubunit Na+/H+ antiporter MnhE subunit